MTDEAQTSEPVQPGPRSPRRTGLSDVYAGLASSDSPAAGCCMPAGAARTTPTDLATGDGACPDDDPPALGCGDPLAFADLRPGENVLDLGCGAGGDCFRAARQVGETGRVLGLDMTPEMIAAARARRDQLGLSNVDFRLGEIEHLPVADASIDVVLSNCVINLCPDRERVFREVFRVLRPGGRLAVCDVLLDGPVPEAVRAGLGEAAQGLVEEGAYLDAIRTAGFAGVRVEHNYFEPAQAAERPQCQRPSEAGSRVAVVRVAETGEERTVRLDEGVAMGRSFSGRVRAFKPDPRSAGSVERTEGDAR